MHTNTSHNHLPPWKSILEVVQFLFVYAATGLARSSTVARNQWTMRWLTNLCWQDRQLPLPSWRWVDGSVPFHRRHRLAAVSGEDEQPLLFGLDWRDSNATDRVCCANENLVKKVSTWTVPLVTTQRNSMTRNAYGFNTHQTHFVAEPPINTSSFTA